MDLLSPLIKKLTKAVLEAQIESFIAKDVLKNNRKNSYSTTTIKGTPSGSFLLNTPRYRNGMFKPQIVKKYQTTLSDEIEEKILSMYALYMSYKDISYTRDISSIYFTKKN